MFKTLCAIRLRLLFAALTGGGRRRKSIGALYAVLLIYCVVVFGAAKNAQFVVVLSFWMS